MKNNLSSFPLKTDEYRKGEMLVIRESYGFEGMARFLILKSIIAEEDGCMLFLPDPNKLYHVGHELSMKIEELAAFIDFLVSRAIIYRENDFITITHLQEVLDHVNKSRQRAREWKVTRNSSKVTLENEQIKLNKSINNNKDVDMLITQEIGKNNGSAGEPVSFREVFIKAGIIPARSNLNVSEK